MGIGARSIREFCQKHDKIGLASSISLKAIRAINTWSILFFDWLEPPKGDAVTSTITMLEVLVQPYRLPNHDLVNQFYAWLSA